MEITRSENVIIVKNSNGAYVTSDKVSDVLLYEILQALKGGLTKRALDGACACDHETVHKLITACSECGLPVSPRQ